MSQVKFQISSGIILIIISIFLLSYIIPQLKDVNYGISLNTNKIVKGEDTPLFLKINNNLGQPIHNTTLKYEITDTSFKGNISLGSLGNGGVYTDTINISTKNLDKMVYTIKTTLIYDSSQGHKEKVLSLSFEVY